MKLFSFFLALLSLASLSLAATLEERLNEITIPHLGFFHTPFPNALTQLEAAINKDLPPPSQVELIPRVGTANLGMMPPVSLTFRNVTAKDAVNIFAASNALDCRFLGNAVIFQPQNSIASEKPQNIPPSSDKLATSSAPTENLSTIHLANGAILENCKIIGASPNGIIIDNGAGLTTITPPELSPEDQAKYHCDASRYREQERERQFAEFIKKNFYVVYDKMKDVLFIYANGTKLEDNFLLYLASASSANTLAPTIRLRITYKDRDWIFWSTVLLLINSNERLSFHFPREDLETEVLGAYSVKEWGDVAVTSEQVTPLKNAKSIQVRLSGKYIKDFSLTKDQMIAIHNIIILYQTLPSMSPKVLKALVQ